MWRAGEVDLVDISDIFYFFPLGEGEGGVRGVRRGKGDWFFIENPRRGGGGSRIGPGGCLRRIGEFLCGGGQIFFFFRGRNVHQVEVEA